MRRSGIARSLIGGAFFAQFALANVSVAQTLPLDPPKLAGYPSVELGEIVLALMAPVGRQVWWDWAADVHSPIIWQNGVSQGNDGSSYRAGVLRINVLGQVSTALEQYETELGWQIELVSSGPEKFGPDRVRLGSGDCFGSTATNCEPNPLPSLSAAKITSRLLCEFTDTGKPMSVTEPTREIGTVPAAFGTYVYLLQASGRQAMVMEWLYDGGSGGASSSFAFVLSANSETACRAGR